MRLAVAGRAQRQTEDYLDSAFSEQAGITHYTHPAVHRRRRKGSTLHRVYQRSSPFWPALELNLLHRSSIMSALCMFALQVESLAWNAPQAAMTDEQRQFGLV